TYDLIGLPPSPQEVEAFLSDTRPDAFARVIDRLLASPHYGERWGRFWLDTARYSDTAGGAKNALQGQDYRYPYAWTYRDYVIKAFNEDKPYDQFIVEQLAADKLPESQTDSSKLAALGFLTVGERFRNPNDIINDRIDVVSKGFLGMTVTCARCHDHMFDPIPTRDYYALHGIFNSTVEPAVKPLINNPSQAQLGDYERKLANLETESQAGYYRFLSRALGEFHGKMGGYLMMTRYGGKKGASAEEIKARNALIQKAGLDRELLPLFLRSFKGADSVFAPFRLFAALNEADFPEKGPELAARIALGKEKGRRTHPLVAAAFQDAHPSTLEEVAAIYTRLFARLGPDRKAYLAACATAPEGTPGGFDPDLVQLLEAPLEVLPASRLDTPALREFVRKLPPQVGRRVDFQFARLNELELTHPGAPARAMLVADAPVIKNSAVFIRGQAEMRGEIVPRRFLEVLSQGNPEAFTQGSGRLELARAIASRENPLTARVVVNRIWLHHFGEGFVPTPDDLGTQSEAPSHPELLDYLASYFM
ncbi:MAG: DUF1549 domain-containing protein, partial [Verrucomicrobiota bacterium]